VVLDPGGGGELQLNWNAAPEPDLAFYRLRYGTASGVYDTQRTFAAGSTAALINGLQDGVVYYLVLEAQNTSGLVSAPTAERQATPRFILGLTPPAAITDLRVGADLGDAVLTWSQVQEDIYGRATVVQEYRVFASAASQMFLLDGAHQIGATPDGPAPSFRHAGGATGPELRYYLVSSRDTSGLDSAGGLGLPAAIYDLQVSEVVPGTLRLAWSPVTTTTSGAFLAVDHYVVYGSLTPFGRADIPGMIPIRGTVLATTVDVDASEGNYFSVLAVDGRGDLSPY
jgi:hypothetical protein